jgi:ABC-type antimicrobial peptide transport system permease subunit
MADAIGRTVEERRFDPARRTIDATLVTVAGVVRDPAYGTLVDGATDVHIYAPFAQEPMPRMMIVARSSDGRSVANDVRAVIASMRSDVSVLRSQPAEEYSSLGLMPQRVGASMTASLGLVGLLLTGIGIYGVTAHAVARRTREIGIRIALGATMSSIARLIVAEGMRLIVTGVAIGLLLGAGAAQLVSGYLFDLPPLDPLAFVGGVSLFVAVGLAACSIPGRRAVTIAPTEALRQE